MVSTPKMPANSSRSRSAADRSARFWSTVSAWSGNDVSSGSCALVVGNEQPFGGNVREQEHGEADGEQAADELRHDERGHAARRDSGEGVGERSGRS